MTEAIQKAREAHEKMKRAMNLWRTHGGSQHGPHVETITMPLDNFAGFLAALDAETPDTPADVGEEPVAWRWKPKTGVNWIYHPDIEWLRKQSDDEIDREPLYSATVRERDEQQRGWESAYALARKLEHELHEANERAETAEAKLAEARKVIDDLKQNARVAIDAGEVLIGVLLDEKQALRARLAHYEQHEKKNKRPFSDRHAQRVIEGQVKEIERLQKLLAEARKMLERVAMNEVGSTAHYIAVCDARRCLEETK